MSRIVEDARIDPRIKAVMGSFPSGGQSDVKDRDALLAELDEPAAVAAREQMIAALDALDSEDIAPSAGGEIPALQVTPGPPRKNPQNPVNPPHAHRPPPRGYFIH